MQPHLDQIAAWTRENKMLLNKEKSKTMIFNFTKNFKFSTRLSLENVVLEETSETKLLGVLINNKLDWDSNTAQLIRKGNARMRILHKLVEFGIPREDLKTIYILYVRSHLEQSCQVWHSSLTLENLTDLERVQKNALRIILQEDYQNYSQALEAIGLDSLFERREKLCLSFAKKCLKSPNIQVKNIFPLNKAQSTIDTRKPEKYHINMASTIRYKKSAVLYMQRMLNNENEK